jgi:hypothetical protein
MDDELKAVVFHSAFIVPHSSFRTSLLHLQAFAFSRFFAKLELKTTLNERSLSLI